MLKFVVTVFLLLPIKLKTRRIFVSWRVLKLVVRLRQV